MHHVIRRRVSFIWLKIKSIGERSVAQLVGFYVVKPVQPGFPDLKQMLTFFFEFIPGFNNAFLSVVGDTTIARRMW
jgi:hypothetical protein